MLDVDEQAGPGCMRSLRPTPGVVEWYLFCVLFIVQIGALATVVVVELARRLRACGRCYAALRAWIGGCRRRTGLGGERSAADQKAEAKVRELRVQWARGLWPLVASFWLPWSTGWTVWKFGLWHGEEDAAFGDLYRGSILLHAAVSVALAVTMLRPSLVTSAFLDRLNIVLSALFHVHVLLTPDGQWGYGLVLSLLGHGVLGVLCGNAALSTVLNTSLGILGVVQYTATCTAAGVVEACASACATLCFFVAAMWTTELLMHRWARLLLRVEEAARDLSLMERLLCGMCDACVLLGPHQDVFKVPSLCCSFLPSDGGAGLKFEDFVVESERARVAEFFDSEPRCGYDVPGRQGGVEAPSFAGSIHTSMRQPDGAVLPVQIYHASLGVLDERMHIIGIREEQEGWTEPAAASKKRGAFQKKEMEQEGAEGEYEDEYWWLSAPEGESDASASGDSLQDFTTFPLRHTEIDLCFSVIEGGDKDVFPVTAVSPAFAALFGIRSVGRGADVEDVASLLSDSVCAKFEDWVHTEWLNWTSGSQKGSRRSRWFHFCVPGLRRLGVDMVALCSMETCDNDEAIVKVALEKFRWKRHKQQPPGKGDL